MSISRTETKTKTVKFRFRIMTVALSALDWPFTSVCFWRKGFWREKASLARQYEYVDVADNVQIVVVQCPFVNLFWFAISHDVEDSKNSNWGPIYRLVSPHWKVVRLFWTRSNSMWVAKNTLMYAYALANWNWVFGYISCQITTVIHNVFLEPTVFMSQIEMTQFDMYFYILKSEHTEVTFNFSVFIWTSSSSSSFKFFHLYLYDLHSP